jgi:hypothetical protein
MTGCSHHAAGLVVAAGAAGPEPSEDGHRQGIPRLAAAWRGGPHEAAASAVSSVQPLATTIMSIMNDGGGCG